MRCFIKISTGSDLLQRSVYDRKECAIIVEPGFVSEGFLFRDIDFSIRVFPGFSAAIYQPPAPLTPIAAIQTLMAAAVGFPFF